eukprot:147076-Pyramimonas_sp.AAC.1
MRLRPHGRQDWQDHQDALEGDHQPSAAAEALEPKVLPGPWAPPRVRVQAEDGPEDGALHQGAARGRGRDQGLHERHRRRQLRAGLAAHRRRE